MRGLVSFWELLRYANINILSISQMEGTKEFPSSIGTRKTSSELHENRNFE